MNVKARVAAALSAHVFLWLLMLLALAGVLSVAAGLYLVLAPPLGPAAAAFITGIALLALVALAGLGIYRSVTDRRRETKVEPSAVDRELRPMLGDRATEWARDHTGTALVGALSAGVLLAVSPGLRRTITRAVGPVITREAVKALQRFSERP